VSCLREKAQAVLECVVILRASIRIKTKIRITVGEVYLVQSYYSQFTNRRQKSGEDEATLDSDIERLSQLAYPECSHQVRDKIACAQFISVLSNRFVRRTLQLEGIIYMKMAVQRTMAVKVIQESNFERDKEYKNDKRSNFRERNHNFTGNRSYNSDRDKSENENKKRE